MIIDVGRDYSPFPGGRVREDGPFNGQEFREDVLMPALLAADHVVIVIDSAKGYGSSFLEEAFGGLVRNGGFSLSELKEKLEIRFTNPGFKFFYDDVWQYIADAEKAKAH